MSAEDLARVQARATECHRQVHFREVDWPEHSPMWLCSGRLVERYQQHGQSPQAADAAALGAAMAFREADWPSWRRGLGAAMTCCGASHSTCERFSIVFFQAKNCSSAPETLRTELTRCGIQVPSTPSCVKAIDLLRVNDFKSFVVPSERKERKKEKFSLEKDKLALEKEKEQR